MTDIYTRRGHLDADRHREKTCEDKETRWPSTSQGKRPGTDPSVLPSEGTNSANTPISDLQPLDCSIRFRSRSLDLQPAVLRYGSPSKVIQPYSKDIPRS